MEFREVLANFRRLCSYYGENADLTCDDCPFYKKECEPTCLDSDKEVAEFEEIVIKWAKEHPLKTRLDIFKERNPGHRIINYDDLPCAYTVGLREEMCDCLNCEETCTQCWDTAWEER